MVLVLYSYGCYFTHHHVLMQAYRLYALTRLWNMQYVTSMPLLFRTINNGHKYNLESKWDSSRCYQDGTHESISEVALTDQGGFPPEISIPDPIDLDFEIAVSLPLFGVGCRIFLCLQAWANRFVFREVFSVVGVEKIWLGHVFSSE